jgi:predicted O-methyltransferase YrrM
MSASVIAVLKSMAETPELLEKHWCVSPETGRFLSWLAQGISAPRILEVGTSIGYSTLWFAHALLERSEGHITTIDASQERLKVAHQHFATAGVTQRITTVHQPAQEALKQCIDQQQRFEVMFIDARKSEYFQYFQAAQTLLVTGGLLIADNTQSHREKMMDFLAAVHHASGWQVSELSLGSGLLLARKQ